MCMQDLIIARAVTMNVVPLTQTKVVSAATYFIVPPNPNRVWGTLYDANVGTVMAWLLELPTISPPQVRSVFASTSATISLSAADQPGVFNSPLLVSIGTGAVTLVEGVLDPALADAVSAGYAELLAARR